jgi:WD40 repeat protein/Ca2+-binding EF-hand superfamily protein
MSRAEAGSVPLLDETTSKFIFPDDQKALRFDVEWTTKSFGLICDLDLNVYCYDERARFIEMLDVSSKRTADGACVLLADQDSANTTSNVFSESLKVDFRLVDKETSAILLYLDGGPRNFQFVSSIATSCNPLALRAVVPGQAAPPGLFMFGDRTRKEFQGVAMCVLFKDGLIEGTDQPQWVCKRLLMPAFTSNKKAKEDFSSSLVIGNVPSLEKFKPRLFESVDEICACLSSATLPKLKKKFTAFSGGLQIGRFTEVIFKQLCRRFPKILEPTECAYTVAMIQEMFQQIDYNGDGGADWDEFTTFCIQTASEVQGQTPQGASMNEYVIEYAEDSLRRDRVLSPYRPVALMRFIKEERKFLVIPDEADKIILMDEMFRVRSELSPYNVSVKNAMGQTEGNMQSDSEHKIMLYDVIFLACKNLYAFSASDHSITIVREQGGVGNRKATHVLYSRLFHDLLHLKLCWSNSHEILCSVASNRVIYGWNIDKQQPIFHVSRHSDIVTDFLAVDSMDVFVTCGMDKKIVMWSALSRRVKGIFLGHKRGVRCLSIHETTMLSAGFEADARTWDLNTKDNIAILKGHRFPIASAKLMCDLATAEHDYRAVTVDESGEIRLWNIFVKERSSSAVYVPTLQVFEMSNPQPPTQYIRFLAVPGSPNLSTSYYSNLVAVGTKMMNFIPEKNAKEFVPPSASEFNSTAAELVTCVGKNLYKYDVCKGGFSTVVTNLHTADLCSLCLDGPRGRRMFVGCGNGDVLLINYLSGQIIDKVTAHKKEVNSICCWQGSRNNVYSASADGSIAILEESHGSLHVHNLVENAFGNNVGAASIKVAPSVLAVLALSTGQKWGLWNSSTGKKLVIFKEASPVAGCEIIGASRDPADLQHMDDNFATLSKAFLAAKEKEKLLTVAIGTTTGVSIYTIDMGDIRGVSSFFCACGRSVFMTALQLLRYPTSDSVNYAGSDASADDRRGELNLMATTDDGYIMVWGIENVRLKSESNFRNRFNSNSSSMKKKGGLFLTSDDSPPRPGTADTADTAGTDQGSPDSIHNEDVQFEDSIASSMGMMTDLESETFFATSCSKGKPFFEKMELAGKWVAHKDSISVSVPMPEHNCLVTGSHDGFHRVWNLDENCLGEMKLPNLTEKMKAPKDPIMKKAGWKFILERMTVTDAHRDLADRLTAMIKKYGDGHDESDRDRRIGNISAVHLGQLGAGEESENDEDEANEDEDSILRKMALGAMVEEIGPRDDGPPMALPSDDELRLQELQLKLDTHAEMTARPASPNGQDAPQSAPGKLEGFRVKATDSIDTVESSEVAVSPIKKLSHFGMNTKQALWSIASDNLKDNAAAALVAPAFSEESLARSMSEGLLDEESHSLLRRVSLDKVKVHSYMNNKKGVVLLRSPSLSTTIALPALEGMRRAEVSFGPQKDYYKNAEKFLNERDNLKKDKMRHAITLNRIESNVKKLGSMIHLVDPMQVDDVAIPDDHPHKEYEKKLEKQERHMRMRLMMSHNSIPDDAMDKQRPLNRSAIVKAIARVDAAVDPAIHEKWDQKYAHHSKKQSKAQNLPQAAKEALEKKVRSAMRDEYLQRVRRDEAQKEHEAAKALGLSPPSKQEQQKAHLDTRALLPYYKAEDVRYFMDIFTKVDEDFSGDLDMNEWLKLFSTLSSTVPVQEARSIFMKFKNEDGYLSVNELVPVVFNKGSKEQHKLITKFCQAEIMKTAIDVQTLSFNDIESFFETLDTDNLGFVPVAIIRDKIRSFSLPESCISDFLNGFKDIDEDEMLNQTEFGRMFKIFVSKADLQAMREEELASNAAVMKTRRNMKK